MAKFKLEEAVELTFAYEVSPYSVDKLISNYLEEKETLVSACFLLDIKVKNTMFRALANNNLSKFFTEIDGINNDKAAKILDATHSMWCLKEFGVKSDEFIGAIEDINPKLLTGEQ